MSEHDRAAALATAVLRFRRKRSTVLPSNLFAEPAWDLLLELFVADAEGTRLTGRTVSERSQIPFAVMSRWLKHLSAIKLIVGDGSGDLDDELVLSGEGFEAVESMMLEAETLREAVSQLR